MHATPVVENSLLTCVEVGKKKFESIVVGFCMAQGIWNKKSGLNSE